MAITPSQRELVQAQADAWFAECDLLRENGKTDTPKLRALIADLLVAEAVVDSRAERKTKALAPGAITVRVVPSVQHIAVAFEDATEIEQAAFKNVVAAVWGVTSKTDHNGPMQRLIGEMTDGKVLITAPISVGTEQHMAAYVTDNDGLIVSDYFGPLERAQSKIARRMALNMAMVGTRIPRLAKRAESLVNTTMRSASAHAKDEFRLAIGAATDESEPDAISEAATA
jgi:hypothetical protein